MARLIVAGVGVTYLLAVIQTTLGGMIAIRGAAPDLLLLWTISIGLVSGRMAGSLAGFGSGVIEGALMQTWIGALAISKALSGFGAGLIAAKVFKDHWAVPSISAVLLTLVNEVAFLFVSHASRWEQVGPTIGIRLAYHAVLAPVVFAVTMRARRALAGRQEEMA